MMAAALLAAVPVLPAQATPTASPSPVPQIAHVTTSDRGSEATSRAARTTFVVTAADIARNGYRTVADALETVPGVNIQSYGAFGALETVGLRGSSPQQVLVLLDGLPIAGAQTENVDLGQMPVASIDRIEVVEGGGSTLYGSGSIGGVINIITHQRAQSGALLSTASFGEQTYQFDTPYVSYSRTYAANDYALPGGGTRQNADAGLTSVQANFQHRIGTFDLSFSGDVIEQLQGDPGEVGAYSSLTSRQGTIDRDVRVNLDQPKPQSTLSLALGVSSQDVTYACDTPVDFSCPNGYPPGANPPYQQLLFDNRVMASLRNAVGTENERLVYGIDLSRGMARIDTGTPPAGQLAVPPIADAYAQTAAYLQSQWFSKNGGEFYAGLRGEHDLNSQANSQGGALSPSIGGIVPLTPSLQLKVNAATAFRAPTAEELFYPPQGVYSNDALVPERTRVGDATFAGKIGIGDVSAGWFTTSGSNMIVDANPALYNYEPVNIGRASIQGVLVALTTHAYHRIVTTVSITDLYRAEDLETQTRIAGRGPVIASSFGFRYVPIPNSRFDGAGVTIVSNGSVQPADYTQPYYAQASAFTRVDAYTSYRVAPKLVVSLRGFNLLDDRYAVYNGFPMPGRSFALELRTR